MKIRNGVGSRPNRDFFHEDSVMDKADPLQRYQWLCQRYTFGGEYTFAVYDEVGGTSYGCSGRYVSELEVYPTSVTEEQFPEWLRGTLEKHTLTDCFLLDKEGKEIGSLRRYFEPEKPSDFLEVKFFVLENIIRREKVVVYEMV